MKCTDIRVISYLVQIISKIFLNFSKAVQMKSRADILYGEDDEYYKKYLLGVIVVCLLFVAIALIYNIIIKTPLYSSSTTLILQQFFHLLPLRNLLYESYLSLRLPPSSHLNA